MCTFLNETIMSSTMFDVKIDRLSPTDLYEQVAGEIRRAIAEGEAKVGHGCRWPRTWPPCWA